MANDFIKRRDALVVIETANSMAGSLLEATMKLCMTMNNIAAVDAMRVVRCRDCVHGKCKHQDMYLCFKDGEDVPPDFHDPDWYCADGEPKSKND